MTYRTDPSKHQTVSLTHTELRDAVWAAATKKLGQDARPGQYNTKSEFDVHLRPVVEFVPDDSGPCMVDGVKSRPVLNYSETSAEVEGVALRYEYLGPPEEQERELERASAASYVFLGLAIVMLAMLVHSAVVLVGYIL